ncbi:MAG: MBL fold metallo-hydrolase [Henriciella sp.]
MRTVILSLLSCFWLPLAHAHPETPAETTYLGNEGIMVSDGHTTVLFDPLFPNGFGTFQLVPEEMRLALMAGEAPFEAVDAIFISHMHPDHFSVDEVIKYLDTHQHVRAYVPAQAAEWMRQETESEEIFERVIEIPLEYQDAPLSFEEGELQIDVVRIPHAGWPGRADVSNLVWRVTLADGITVMHLGDADPNDVHFAPLEEHWQAKRTHTAYPPYWFFGMGDGPLILDQRLNSEHVTGIHVPVEVPPQLVVTGADFFHLPGETRTLEKPEDE